MARVIVLGDGSIQVISDGIALTKPQLSALAALLKLPAEPHSSTLDGELPCNRAKEVPNAGTPSSGEAWR